VSRRSLTALVATIAVAGLAGCGSSHGTRPLAAGGSNPPASGHGPSTPAAASHAAGTTGAPAASGTASAPAPAGSAQPKPSGSVTSPPPEWHATEQEIPIDAAVTPACVLAGTAAKLSVHTVAKGAIAFVAVYHGEKSGAAPPFGEGYGGNDKGTADGSGSWSSTWTVTANAPNGAAYVLLVVGSHGKQRQIKVPFSVGGATGCS
jgi:hypothetical protein